MIPSPLRRNVESAAERKLYRRFEEALPDPWTVVHQARWVGRRRGLEGRDGEIDFVLLHPEMGIVVLEAKGGRVVRDGRTGTWRQGMPGHEEVLDPSPLEQALDAKHQVLRLLRHLPRLQGREHHVVHGIACPEIECPADGLGTDAPRALVLDSFDVREPTAWAEAALASVDRARPDLPPLGPDGVEALVDALAVRRTVPLHSPALAADAEAELGELTEEQFEILDLIAQVPRAQVVGGPGTGKTLLAVEAARRFAAQGLETLLVCFNAPLGGFLRETNAGRPHLLAGHFHGVCRRVAEEAGLGPRVASAENAKGYETEFPDLLVEALDRLGRRFDAVVVDEAQDFRETWWAALECALADAADARLMLFEDELQAFDQKVAATRPANLVGPLPLHRDCRNPDEIHAFLAACPGGPKNLKASGVSTGVRPRVSWVEDAGKLKRLLSATVARLIRDWSVPPRDIAVLTPRSPERSALGALDRLGPAPVSWRRRESARHVLVDTIYRFKGLEAVAVVLVELEPDGRPSLETCLRVGCSRPKLHLDLLAPRTLEPRLGAALAFADVLAPAS